MGKKCVYCRNDMGVYTTKCPHCNSKQPPERKKPSIILGCGGIFFTFCFALLGFAYCTPHENKPAVDPETSYTEPTPKETEAPKTQEITQEITQEVATESPAPAEQPTEAPETTEQPTEPPTEAPQNAGSELLYDDGEIRITYTGSVTESWIGMFEIHVLIENNGNRNLCVQADNFSINGYMFEPLFSCDVAPGKKANDTISVFLSDNNLTFADATEAETKFHIFDWDDWGYSKDTNYISFGF